MQRFGSALNLNVHFHAVLPDGVFVPQGERVTFRPLAPPSDEEVADLTAKIVRRVTRRLGPRLEDPDEAATDDLAAEQAAAIAAVPRGTARDPDQPARRGRRCAALDGFSLHANVRTSPHDPDGIEKLCRYGGRPPLALSRLSQAPDGAVVYRLKRRAPGAPPELRLAPLAFLRRLALLVPPPRAHQVRYHGVFAPAAPLRARIVPAAPPSVGDEAPTAHPAGLLPRPPATLLERRLPWADLLERVFRLDVLACPCGGRRRVVAFITDKQVSRRILAHLGLASHVVPTSRTRAPPADDFPGWLDEYFVDPTPQPE